MIPESIKVSVSRALAILPIKMDSIEARCLLYAIGLQESGFTRRVQFSPGCKDGRGPAHGYWQFERGTAASRGGVWGVILHQATSGHLNTLCQAMGVPFDAQSIWAAIEHDDVLAAGLARLMLFADSKPLPKITDAGGALACYLRVWRPGKPRQREWPENHAQAVEAVDRRSP